ncbi:hypothetical protein BDV95DRAFT_607408 [Massariosphaeria phaeospora]|uniref:Uncharacterized protein n=1 Tax=Massariosphaeria phaeospora TaxID=100035 RepID=A0A7C8ID64_9PLEO|nr:hypothetical protein BDV95DRAFT_607408 [Massariosphaeria phaeospora]
MSPRSSTLNGSTDHLVDIEKTEKAADQELLDSVQVAMQDKSHVASAAKDLVVRPNRQITAKNSYIAELNVANAEISSSRQLNVNLSGSRQTELRAIYAQCPAAQNPDIAPPFPTFSYGGDNNGDNGDSTATARLWISQGGKNNPYQKGNKSLDDWFGSFRAVIASINMGDTEMAQHAVRLMQNVPKACVNYLVDANGTSSA